MAQLFFNNARGVLDAGVSASDTTIRIADAVGLPSALASGDWFLLTLYKDSRQYGEDHEVVRVTAASAEASPTVLVYTVVRGAEFAATAHVVGERAEARVTAGTLGRIESDAQQYAESTAKDWDTQVTGKPATFPPSSHSHVLGDVSGLQPALDDKRDAADTAFPRYDLASVTTTALLDLAVSNVFRVDASSPASLALANPPGEGRAMTVVIHIIGNSAVSWPADIVWDGATAPELGVNFTRAVLIWDGSLWTGFSGEGR